MKHWFLTALASVVLGLGMSAGVAAADKLRVVYHVSEAEKVPFALRNMRNHIKGAGGADNVELVLVAHGPALKGFSAFEVNSKVSALFDALKSDGVEFNACGNTMRVLDYQLDDLVPGFVRVDQGGVVRIAELQSQGYLYIRP